MALASGKAELDACPYVSEEAKEKLGAIDRVEWNLVTAASVGDILVLAVPLAELENTLMVIGEDVQPHALVLDLAPLKVQSLRWAEKHLKAGHYVGVMPVLLIQFIHTVPPLVWKVRLPGAPGGVPCATTPTPASRAAPRKSRPGTNCFL